MFGEKADRGPTGNVGPSTAVVAVALVLGVVWLCVRHTMLALFCVIVAAVLAVVFWLLFGGDSLLAHPLFGLVVIAIGAAIGLSSNRNRR
jgi:hypothetical protein